MFESYDFKPGIVTYNPFKLSPFDSTDQDWINEDLVQVSYSQGYVLDVGWYKGISRFVIWIIKDNNWEEPVHKKNYRTIQELYEGMEKAIAKMNKLLNESFIDKSKNSK